ncbi:hypothetical protein, partial [Actinoplanes sp. TFC3]|uniref:hypothetical protein n=1 Tax=Actinoplanes sp. TFC3 TaxID=1710355 RepID=UPI00191C68FC
MSRPPLHRPMLLPGLPRIWRGERTLQLGLHSERAILIDLPNAATAKILDLLDGTRPESAILRAAASLDITPVQTRALLDALHGAGLVISSQTLYPPALDATTRRLLFSEAAALALAVQATQPVPGEPQPGLDPPVHEEPIPPEAPPSRAREPSTSAGMRADDQSATPAEATPVSDSAPAQPEQHPEAGDERSGPDGRFGPRKPNLPNRPPTPAAILRRRRSAKIVVTGRGRLGAGIAVGLAEAGIGHVHADLPGTVSHVERVGGPLRNVEAGAVRTDEVIKAIQRVAPGTETRSIRRGTASLVVQLCHDEPVGLLAFAHTRRRQPYLSVAVREGTAVIGPLVPADGQPCLNCLAMCRQNYEGGEFREFVTAGDEPLAVATVLAACGYAISEVLNYVDGLGTETLGAEVEIHGPGRLRRRQWYPHPYCVCGQRPARTRSRAPRQSPTGSQRQARAGSERQGGAEGEGVGRE